MSTITRIDPTVRRERAARRIIVRQLRGASARLPGMKGVVTLLMADTLRLLQRNPALTGAEKQAAFNHILTRLQEAI